MGMKLKPSKCRSFSILSGKPSIVDFYIGEHKIPSIANEEQKFFGKVIFFSGKSSKTIEYFNKIFNERLSNIDNMSIRGEYKLWIYQNYFLPSIKILLTVHEINISDIKKLESISHRYFKTWCDIPQCGTNKVFHSQKTLNI